MNSGTIYQQVRFSSGREPTQATYPVASAVAPRLVAQPGVGRIRDGILVEVSPRLCELTGLQVETLVGAPFKTLFADPDQGHKVIDVLREQLRQRSYGAVEADWLETGTVSLLASLATDDPASEDWIFAVSAARLQDEAQEEIALCHLQLAAFHAISEIMQNDEPDAGAFNAIARKVSEISGFPVVAIELCDFSRAVMVYCGSHGVELEGLPEPLEIPMDVTPSGQVALSGQKLIETEAAVRRECAAPFFRQLAAETFVCVPIKNSQEVVGALSLAQRTREIVPPRVILLVESFANYLATLFGRLRAREAVRKGEAELAAVYDRAPSMMCLLDENLQIVRANRAALEFTNKEGGEGLQLSVGQFLNCPNLVCNSNAKCGFTKCCAYCELRRAIAETLKTGRPWHRVRIRKGLVHDNHKEEHTLLISTERLRVDGITRVLLCLEDITQAEAASEKIRSQAALLEVARDAIVVRDFADKISYWNEGAHRMYGWAANEALGRTLSELLLGKDSKQAAEAFQSVQEHEDWVGEMQHITRSGERLTVQSRWTLVRSKDGSPEGILIVNTDLTEKKRLEAQLLRAQRLESIGTLASGLAHDLNNVLAPILMSVHMLKEEAVSESMQTCLETLEACAQRGSGIVSQVLMFARGVEGSRVPIHPKHLMGDIQRIVRETFPRSIRIESQIAKQSPLVECDATQLQQVLMNLCVNARDAMPQGGTLTLKSESRQLGPEATSLHPKARSCNYIVLSVADTGTGIAPEILEKIFDPFFTTKPLGHGTGLGLPIVMGIAENHGGFVHVESLVGVGTTFRVFLPAAMTEHEKLVGPRGGVNLPQGNGEIILVVDDEPAIRRIVDVILSKNGYQTLVAPDGREAVKLFQQRRDRVVLLITDLMMPYQDGPTTIRAIRQIKSDIRVIAITGLGEETRIAEAKGAGAETFIKKPFTAEELLTAVRERLDAMPAAAG